MLVTPPPRNKPKVEIVTPFAKLQLAAQKRAEGRGKAKEHWLIYQILLRTAMFLFQYALYIKSR